MKLYYNFVNNYPIPQHLDSEGVESLKELIESWFEVMSNEVTGHINAHKSDLEGCAIQIRCEYGKNFDRISIIPIKIPEDRKEQIEKILDKIRDYYIEKPDSPEVKNLKQNN